VRDHTWWQMDFPDRGTERHEDDAEPLLAELEQVLLRAVERRLRADVPVVAYSSGGLDSSLLVAMARKIQGRPLTTFTFRVSHPGVDETKEADIVARHVGNETIPIPIDAASLLGAYPRLVHAAESPVVDTSAAALLLLAAGVHEHGYKAVLTGEGSDEWLAGYPWFRIDKKVELVNFIPGVRLSRPGFRLFELLLGIPRLPRATESRMYQAVGGHNAWMYAYFLMSSNQLRFFSEPMLERLGDYVPLADVGLNFERMRAWHPMNRSLYIGARVHLTGLHLGARGDRSTMHSSVQSRFPFLDEEVYRFLASLDPQWKMRGLQDKYILRRLAERWLPPDLTRGRKRLIHAPLHSFHHAPTPAWMDQLLSEESLRKTGYFKPEAVAHWRQAFKQMRHGYARLFVEMGLVGVISTQLWHHMFIDPSLADLPSDRLPAPADAVRV
jgi:asparagine synthase (glutamine-hydrolysing)